jgi:Zn-dependent protease with chaperone function
MSAITHAPWENLERESFFAALARHRRAAWRVTALCVVGNGVLALVVATLMSPLFYALIALVLDLINLAIPMPNLVHLIGSVIGPAMDHPERVPLWHWLEWALIAALPGLLWMTLLLRVLARVLRAAAAFGVGELPARAPDTAVLAEQRMANVIEEMAIAAALPPPRVLITDRPTLNAAVIGRDERHATIIVSATLLATLDREQMQGVAAHLIASIANGDMTIGTRAALTLTLFGTIARFSTLLTDGGGWSKARQMARALLNPTGHAAQGLAAGLADPFKPDQDEKIARAARRRPDSGTHNKTDWRALAWMPLAGPVWLAGFLGGMVSTMALTPLLALAWRQRKYMADAIAVQLTRDPDALAGALTHMGGGAVFAPWAAHLCVAQNGGGSGALGSSFVPMIPGNARRLRALVKLGAHVSEGIRPRLPRAFVLIVAPLAALVGVLLAVAVVLMVWLSTALSMLFTGLPFAVIHQLLRLVGR